MSFNKSKALKEAEEYVLQRNLQAAVKIYQEIIESDPGDLAVATTLGDLYAGSGLVQEAIALFSRVAASYIAGGSSRKAIATLKKIIAVDPENSETATRLADLYAQAGLPSEARQHYLQIAETLTRNGQMLDALSVYGKVVDLDPLNTSTRIKLGELYLREGMSDQAYDAFVKAAEQLTSKGENRRALNAYNEALAIRPDSEVGAVAQKLMASLGVVDPGRSVSRQASQTGRAVVLAGESSMRTLHSEPTNPPAALDNEAQPSNSFVVQEISKAEILVAYGQVRQAVAMLRDVLRERADDIDVHIKLKDIYLRTGMMAEAAQECVDLERIYEARGDADRARDYAVRASRLTQLIEHPSGDLPKPRTQPAREPEPRVSAPQLKVSSPPNVAGQTRPVGSLPEPRPVADKPEARPVANKPEGRPVASLPEPRPVARVLESRPVARVLESRPVANKPEPRPVASLPEPRPVARVLESRPVANKPEARPVASLPQARPVASLPEARPARPVTVSVVPASQSAVDVATIREPDLHPVSLSSSVEALVPISEAMLDRRLSPAVVAIQVTSQSPDVNQRPLPVLFAESIPVARSRGLTAAIAAGVLVVLGAGAVVGGFAYNSHLDKQYQSLALAAPLSATPTPPSALEAEEYQSTLAVDEPMEEIVVTPTAQSDAAQPKTREPEPVKAKEQPPAAPNQPASEVPKVKTQAPLVLPRAAVSADNRSVTDNRTPLGVPGDVPIGPTHPAEPPPRVVRQSPGVVVGGAVRRVDPVYPSAARDARQMGAVTVEVTISERGDVTAARALSGPGLLQNAAVAAARGWKFKASTLGGIPVTTTTTIVFNFKL